MAKEEIGYLWREYVSSTKVRFGLSSSGLNHLGTIEWISFPEVGSSIEKDEALFMVESSKAAIEVESPISGTVTSTQTCTKEFLKELFDLPQEVWLVEMEYA